MSLAAMKQALEALLEHGSAYLGHDLAYKSAITVLRAAIEHAERPAPIKMEGGIADPDEFVWECNCEDCQVRYTEWKAAFDQQQKELIEKNT